MMFLWSLLTTALALSSYQTLILTEELDVAFSPDVNDNLSLLLGLDAFQKLDLDGDGFLTKQEIKPYVTHYTELATHPLSEHGGKMVLREEFEKGFVVPNLGAIGSDLNTDYCYLDHAFAETSASALWITAFGEVDYVSSEEFVEQSFETWQTEIKAPVQNLMNKLQNRKALASFDYSKVPFVKLDDYLTVNSLCEGRRELFWQVPAASTVLRLVGTWALAGMAESGLYCTYQAAFFEGCSFGDWAQMSVEGAGVTAIMHMGGMAVAPWATAILGGSAAVAPIVEEIAPQVIGAVEEGAIELGEIILEDAECLWVFC